MASVTAASYVPYSDMYSSYQHWAWLADYWRGQFCPHITINIQFFEPSLFGSEVIRVHGQTVNALLLTSLDESALVSLSARQVCHLLFKVDEWLRVD